MPTYISLVSLTDQGLKNIADAPKRLEDAERAFKEAGGRLVDFYLVMGAYDYVVVAEAPNDEAVVTLLLKIGSRGNVRTTTMRAFKRDEFVKVIQKL